MSARAPGALRKFHREGLTLARSVGRMRSMFTHGARIVTLHRPLIPEFFAADVRPDWEHFAMVAPINAGHSDHWAAADLCGIGDTESAADLFVIHYFGA